MKRILGAVVVASLTLTACGKNTETAIEQEQAAVATTEQEQSQITEKFSISATQSITAHSTVEAINLETRRINLRNEDGTLTSTIVSEDAHNLDQVKIGDVVVVEYIENLSIDVVSVENAEALVAEASVVARAEKGEAPGMAKIDTIVATAIVEEINLEANTFKLKDAEGDINEYEARKPENLRKAAVGDMVIITLTRAVAITVEQ